VAWPLWVTSHILGSLGGFLTLLGLSAWYVQYAARLGKLGLAGFVFSALFMADQTGTGLFGAVLWPAVAQQAPDLLAEDGPLFGSSLYLIILVVGVLEVAGLVILAMAALQAKACSRWAAWLVVVGVVTGLGVIISFPVGLAGGVIASVGLARIGLELFRASRSERRLA
jgi:hypothetical protein